MEIPESESRGTFAGDAYFHRSRMFKSNVTSCSREELIDLSIHLLGKLESIQGMLERMNFDLESILGYTDPLRK